MSATLDRIKHAKSQLDIVEVIGRYVQLKKDGANYIGSSPFTSERTPSFVVNPVKNFFKCFSSGESGDALDFVMKHKNLPILKAIEYLKVAPPDQIPEYIAPPPIPVSYMDSNVMYSTLRGYNSNDFVQWLITRFGISATEAIAKYRVGTSKHKFWNKEFPDYKCETGATIFWYCDISDKVRGGKLMAYDIIDGKRIKKPFDHISWVHKALKIKPYNMELCLFGEHLLPGDIRDVHIFESEKSAIVSSLCYPDWLCLATGALTNLTFSRCEILAGKTVILHPDVGVEYRWVQKIKQFEDVGFDVSKWSIEWLFKGYDFCDWIIDNLI